MGFEYSADVTDEAIAQMHATAARLGTTALVLVRVAQSESGNRAEACNPTSSATGWLQWMKPWWGERWGFTRDGFMAIGLEGQAARAAAYFAGKEGRISTEEACYTAVFLPKFLDQAGDPNFVLAAKDGPLGWAYAANAYFDRAPVGNGDGKIQVRELRASILRQCAGRRYRELEARITGVVPEVVPLPVDDLRTIAGVQHALRALDYYLGTGGPRGDGVDGDPGPMTYAAISHFRVSVGLPAGTTPGPRTQAALRAELARVGAAVPDAPLDDPEDIRRLVAGTQWDRHRDLMAVWPKRDLSEGL